ncbi:MAG: SDR family NAD(P)-dependent oxidoreductase [Xenococcaceae cyanobacterium]
MNNSNNPSNNLPNEELVKFLSNYFSQRGSFLAQVIRADFQTLPRLTNHNGAATYKGNGNTQERHNDTATYKGNSSVKAYHHGAATYKGNGNSSNDNSIAPYHGAATYKGNGNSQTHYNGIATTQTIQPSTVPNPVAQKQKETPQVILQQTADVEAILVDLVVQQTGYPQESITLEARLLDDLNLDSIKAGELVAAAASKCGVAGNIDPSSLANATLKEIAAEIRSAMSAEEEANNDYNTIAVSPQAPEALKESVNISELLLALIEERTGFPQKTLSLDLRLLDDLNLDSIKAADLVATAAKQVGVGGQLDPSTLANATLADVVAALQEVQPEVKKPSDPISTSKKSLKASSAKPKETSKWVRNFAIEYVAQDAPQREKEDWSKAKVLIVSDTVDSPVAKALGEQLLFLGAQVETVTYQQVSASNSLLKASFSHYLALLPQTSDQEQESLPLAQMVARLQSIAILSGTSNHCLAYVQFGGGRFGSGSHTMNPEVCCAAAFARSVHLERPDLRVRVVDLAQEIEPNRTAELVISELSGTEAIATVGYDADLVRLVPQSRLQQPANYTKRSLSWSEEDVILVTGGAKGITAECALAFAQSTGAKMVLVGRSPAPAPDNRKSEVAQTLERFQAKGLTCRYYSCDIANADAVAELVKTVTREEGAITGVVHGAGLNTPRRLEQVSLEAAVAEVSPKLLGACNLLQALAEAPPRLFVAFSSIIGVTGMPGNAWYAFANESLAIMLRRFESDHPETKVLSLAYSVWGEVGMGARMGSVKNLERIGIGAISTEEGVGRFLKLFECDPGVKQVVIAACLGGLDTWSPETSIRPPVRFLEDIRSYEPNVEVVSRVHLSLEDDLYLRDHLYRGSYLFPTVFGLEAMAQAVAYATGRKSLPAVRIEDIRLERPIVVSPEQGVDIEIRVEVLEKEVGSSPCKVRAGIGTEQTGFAIAHFSAIFVLDIENAPPLEQPIQLPAAPLRLGPQKDLYGGILFQGSLFQRIQQIYSLDCDTNWTGKCVFSTLRKDTSITGQDGFSPAKSMPLILGDPFGRDSLLQSVQLVIPQDICLPVRIDSIELYQPNHSFSGNRTAVALLEGRKDKEYRSSVFTVDETGRILEKLNGYQLRILEHHDDNPTAQELAQMGYQDEAILREALMPLATSLQVKVPEFSLQTLPGLQHMSKAQRHQRELPILQQMASQVLNHEGESLQFHWSDSGKPILSVAGTEQLNVSLSHTDELLLCVVGRNSQGCDLETITPRTYSEWTALLGAHRTSLLAQLQEGNDSLDLAGTRIWAAVEALRKATGSQGSIGLTVTQRQGSGVIFGGGEESRSLHILTLPVTFPKGIQRLVAMVVEKLTAAPPVAEAPDQARISGTTSESLFTPTGDSKPIQEMLSHLSVEAMPNNGPQGQKVFEHYFPLTFREDANLNRSVYFSNYAKWMGKIRELSMSSVFRELAEQFATGEWGMVTNHSQTRILGEAKLNDLIKARLWLGQVTGPANSTLDLHYDWCRVLPDGGLERVALSEMRVTWVKILDHGIVEAQPFPQYFQRFADNMVPQFEAPNVPAILPEPLANIDLGPELYRAPTGPIVRPLLGEQTFETTLEDANLVGNVYFSNYYMWQGRIRDRAIYEMYPESFRGTGTQGQLRCLRTRVNHLREAMPFDPIYVRMSLRTLYERGINLFFEYFRVTPDGQRYKLATGEQDAVWLVEDEVGQSVAVPLPPPVRQELLRAIAAASPQATSISLNGKPLTAAAV